MPDVRFASNLIVEKYDRTSDNMYPLSVSSVSYPVTFRWASSGIDVGLRVSWQSDGAVHEGVLQESRPLVVTDTSAIGFVLELYSALPLPKAFALAQNYPNPFNPSTVIHYALPSDNAVVLRLYNIIGQEVRTLVDEFQKAGYKSVTFNAENLPSGIYLYSLTAGNFSETRKMVLMK